MKNFTHLIIALFFGVTVFAQTPQSFRYQAVARDNSGNVQANQAVSFRISILSGSISGAVAYSETHTSLSTNAFGLVELEIGKGTPVTGTFTAINWGSNSFYVKVEMDPEGGSVFQVLSTSQLLSVPYALYAWKAGNGFSGNYNDLSNKPLLFDGTWLNITGKPTTLTGYGITNAMSTSHAANGITSNMITNWNSAYGWGNHAGLYKPSTYLPSWSEITAIPAGFADGVDNVDDADNSTSNEIQVLSITDNNLSLSKSGGTITIPGDNWGTQTVIADAGYFTGNGTTATPLKLSSMGASSGQVLKFNGTIWDNAYDDNGPFTDSSNPNAVYYSGDKYIGLGINKPTQKLTVAEGDIACYMNIQNSSTGYTSTDGLILGMSQNDGWLTTYENGKLYLGSNYSAKMTIASDGNIGIGTSTPTQKLSIADDGSTCYMNIQNGTTGYTESDGLVIGVSGLNSYVASHEAGNLYLATNNVNRLEIHSDGKIGIGTSSPAYKLDVVGAINLNKGIVSGQALLVNADEAIWYNGTYFSWGYGGTFNYFKDAVGIDCFPGDGHLLAVNGVASKPGGGSWAAFSDIRLKDIHGNYIRGLSDILQLQPVIFSYKTGNELKLPSKPEYVGFIAQDVQKVFPETVTENKNGYLEFDMHGVNVAVINAIKELKAENDRLKSENKQLNTRLEKIEALVNIKAEN